MGNKSLAFGYHTSLTFFGPDLWFCCTSELIEPCLDIVHGKACGCKRRIGVIGIRESTPGHAGNAGAGVGWASRARGEAVLLGQIAGVGDGVGAAGDSRCSCFCPLLSCTGKQGVSGGDSGGGCVIILVFGIGVGVVVGHWQMDRSRTYLSLPMCCGQWRVIGIGWLALTFIVIAGQVELSYRCWNGAGSRSRSFGQALLVVTHPSP